MLVELSVANFRSIANRQTISLVASADGLHRETHVRTTSAKATPGLLSSAVLYGPNAAGKSNVLLALDFMRVAVRTSFQSAPEAMIAHAPFALGPTDEAEPSAFEAIFVEDGVRYQYGFEVDSQRVRAEWLYAFPEGKQQRWFERGLGNKRDHLTSMEAEDDWYFGPSLQGPKRLWKETTRPNALLLSTAVQLKSDQLKPVYEWFATRLQFIGQFQSVNSNYTAQRCLSEPEFKRRVIDLLGAADLAVSDVRVQKERIDHIEVQADAPEHTKQFLTAELLGKEIAKVSFTHRAPNGREATFPIEQESAGTQKFFHLTGPWLDVLATGEVLVVDELDTSLHPVLLKHLVEMFHSLETNPNNAQLIFSTHDTTLLDQGLFRRDQVWLVEKDREQRTQITPLTDFSPRKGENLEKGYLQGRYGARPLVDLVR